MKYADISLTNCQIKNERIVASHTPPAFNPQNYQNQQPLEIRPHRDFREESNKARVEQETTQKKSKLKVVPSDQKVETECPHCKATTDINDLSICSSCGETICSSCGMESADHKKYCEPCWQKL
jgi:hypothetical protein